MLLFNYGYYEFWEAYVPADDTYGGQKVTFDGTYRIIYVNEGETELDVQIDLYSNWKEWVQVRDHAKYAQAFTAIGGQPISDIQSVGITYFLENGWRIQPWPGDYILTIDGNLYTREAGENPIIPVSGVSTALTRSNLVDLIIAEPVLSGNVVITIPANTEVTVTANSVIDIVDNVWDEVIDVPKSQTAREKLRKVATKTQDLALGD
jgi:hypothetical protein